VIGAAIVEAGRVNNAALSTYRMAITPDRLQGRAQNAMNFAASAAVPIGPLAGGVLLTSLGGTAAQLFALTPLALAVLVITASRTVREVPRPDHWPVVND